MSSFREIILSAIMLILVVLLMLSEDESDFDNHKPLVTNQSMSWSLSVPPENINKTYGFLVFSGCIESD